MPTRFILLTAVQGSYDTCAGPKFSPNGKDAGVVVIGLRWEEERSRVDVFVFAVEHPTINIEYWNPEMLHLSTLVMISVRGHRLSPARLPRCH